MGGRYEYEDIGTNIRFNELAAAIAIPQLERLDEIVAKRRENAGSLSELLADTEIKVPVVPAGRGHVWHQFTVLLPTGTQRDDVRARMSENGIDVGVYYPRLLTDYEVMAKHPLIASEATPVAADAAARCLSLPVHHRLSEDQLVRIAEVLASAVRAA
jgi:dTDP-4-amino-4,6-dideoxygalactose transaminase